MSGERSPAIIIRFPAVAPPAVRDRLVGALADHDLTAIQEDDLSAPRVWTAHFATAAARDRALSAIRTLTDAGQLDLQTVDVEDEDWARRTQADLPAIRVGRVIVAPPWDLPAARTPAGPHPASATAPLDPNTLRTTPGAEVVVEIEPSRGFGTGHHQSTRLCLVLLQNRALEGRTVIDVGTGSGVLAIAAAKLGASYVNAMDIDPDAVENARENVERNGVAAIVDVHVRDVIDLPPPPADLVTANLTGTLLVRYARQLRALVRPAGSLICAGFTVDEKDMVLEAFSGDFDLAETAEEDDWWAFVLTRRRD